MPSTADWKRVGDAVRSRRLELGRTQQEIAEQAAVSLATWRLVETAGRDRYQDLTIRGLCRALGWRPDAIESLLAGDVPQEELHAELSPGDLEAVVPAGLARKWHDMSPAERSKVEGFIDGLLAGRNKG